MRTILFSLLLSFAATSTLAQDSGWMKSSELEAKLNVMDEDRLFPGLVEGRVEGATIRYRAEFIPFLPNMDYFRARWGLSDRWYKVNTEKLTGLGFTEYSHTTFTDQSGSTLHQATWVLINKNP